MQSSKLCFLFAIVLLFALFSMLMFPVFAAGNEEVATSSISEAELSLAQVYEAVLDAESADADVSGLLVQLNDATALLSEAHMAFDVGDFDEATNYAESSKALGNEVSDEAEVLQIEAENARVASSWMLLILSGIGVSIVAVACMVGYRFFKSRYYGRLSKMKPKVE